MNEHLIEFCRGPKRQLRIAIQPDMVFARIVYSDWPEIAHEAYAEAPTTTCSVERHDAFDVFVVGNARFDLRKTEVDLLEKALKLFGASQVAA